jgi:hypothetical protein
MKVKKGPKDVDVHEMCRKVMSSCDVCSSAAVNSCYRSLLLLLLPLLLFS